MNMIIYGQGDGEDDFTSSVGEDKRIGDVGEEEGSNINVVIFVPPLR